MFAVEVVLATAPVVVDMVEAHQAVVVQATLVAPEVVGDMDPMVVEALLLDVEVDIQVLLVEVMVLHNLLQAEEGIPMVHHHHKTDRLH